MRQTRCFVPPPLSAHSIVTLPQAAAAHIRRVLRLRAGAELALFDGRGGEYAARLLDGRDELRVQVGAHVAIERESPLPVTLLQCLARGERMDWIVQKATELGVGAIVPVASRHSVVQLAADAAERRVAHWRSVAIGACEQCGRNRVPALRTPCELHEACAATDATLRLLLLPDAEQSLTAVLAAALAATRANVAGAAGAMGPVCIALLVGPEGGLADDEVALARQRGFHPCRLGPRTLRTETAPLAVLAALQALAGDFR
jgi:16S rRNA (uracil1498-N3)-methyltransferase